MEHLIWDETRNIEITLDIDVTYYNKVEGSFSRNAASDMDYHGYEEIDFEVTRKYDSETGLDVEYTLTEKDIKDIEEAISEENASFKEDYEP